MNQDSVIEMLKADGLRVYMRKPVDSYGYCTDGTGIAYVQWSDYRPGVSTVHVPNKTTGTGFQFSDTITPETVHRAMVTVAPGWAKEREVQSVRKYRNWEEFHSADSWNAGLFEV